MQSSRCQRRKNRFLNHFWYIASLSWKFIFLRQFAVSLIILVMKKILVIGVGKSGGAVLNYLKQSGDQVIAVDQKPFADILPDNTEFKPFDFDLVVVSPGIPETHPLYKRAIDAGIEVVGEAELAFREMKNFVIGITGSNGKSTTTAKIAHILNRSGRRAKALGNIG